MGCSIFPALLSSPEVAPKRYFDPIIGMPQAEGSSITGAPSGVARVIVAAVTVTAVTAVTAHNHMKDTAWAKSDVSGREFQRQLGAIRCRQG